jgi:beta-mannosidase
VVARLRQGEAGEVIGEDFYFPLGLDLAAPRGAKPTAQAEWRADGSVVVTVSSEYLLQSVRVACEGFAPHDNYFHVAPRQPRRVVFTRTDARATSFKAELEPLNVPETIAVLATAGR